MGRNTTIPRNIVHRNDIDDFNYKNTISRYIFLDTAVSGNSSAKFLIDELMNR